MLAECTIQGVHFRFFELGRHFVSGISDADQVPIKMTSEITWSYGSLIGSLTYRECNDMVSGTYVALALPHFTDDQRNTLAEAMPWQYRDDKGEARMAPVSMAVPVHGTPVSAVIQPTATVDADPSLHTTSPHQESPGDGITAPVTSFAIVPVGKAYEPGRMSTEEIEASRAMINATPLAATRPLGLEELERTLNTLHQSGTQVSAEDVKAIIDAHLPTQSR